MILTLGQTTFKSILDSPEARPIEILNVSEVTLEDGYSYQNVTTSSTNAIVQERTEEDFFALPGAGPTHDAVVYLERNIDISASDEITISEEGRTYKVRDIRKSEAYKMAEVEEI